MLPPPIEHVFAIDGHPYRLVEWTRGGERRIRLEYAMAIAAAPGVIDGMDGQSLYAEAVARECLVEAPDLFWQTQAPGASQNGTPRRVVTLEQVPRALWALFLVEVEAFLGKIFPSAPQDAVSSAPAGPGEPVAVATLEAVSPMLRGRAE